MQIEGASALVSGANRGLGKALVEALVAQGARRVYAGARRIETLDAVIDLDPKRVRPVVLDVTDEQKISRAAETCADISLLFNNSGVLLNDGGFVTNPDIDALHHEFDVNFFGLLSMCREFAPILGRNGGGAIVNILSILALVTAAPVGSYCASKAAALALTRSIRAELAHQGTLVVAAMPGVLDTDMGAAYDGAKLSPGECAAACLKAVAEGREDIYPGEQAEQDIAAYFEDYKAQEHTRAAALPEGFGHD